MKRIMLSTKIACGAFILAAATFASCSDSVVGGAEDITDGATDATTSLTTVKLATFAGDQSRVTYAATTRGAEEGAETGKILELIATIDNPDKEVFSNYVEKNEDGEFEKTDKKRYLSATSVFYDNENDKYYATYHMQGNNYNTTLGNDIAGTIQEFAITENGVDLGKGFFAKDREKEDFDFNHIYFDRTSKRILVVGHNQKPAIEKGGNTRAIIGVFDPEEGTMKYKGVDTGEKDYDANGKSLGYKDAGDVNCVMRANDAPGYGPGWDIYFVATRKGMAVLNAKEDKLFEPALNADGTNYFIPTPGSAKYVCPTGTSSWIGLLYLSEEHKAEAYTTSSKANIAKLSVNTKDNELGWLQGWESPFTRFNPQEDKINDFYSKIELPEVISPVDGKNTLCILGNSEFYVALGTSGLYCDNGIDGFKGIKKFGNRPVNCVAVDNTVNESGHSNKNYLYVANGSKLTILDRGTLEEVASWNLPSKIKDDEGNEINIESSANYITVTKADDGVRTITVAYGQAGVRVFKFNPANIKK